MSVRQIFKSSKGSPIEKSLRVFHAVRLPEETNGGYVYEPIDKIVADPTLTEIVLRDMEREWKTLRRRYEDFSEFWSMVRRDVAAGVGAAGCGVTRCGLISRGTAWQAWYG